MISQPHDFSQYAACRCRDHTDTHIGHLAAQEEVGIVFFRCFVADTTGLSHLTAWVSQESGSDDPTFTYATLDVPVKYSLQHDLQADLPMRLALIPLLIVVQLTLIARCDVDLGQQLAAAVADSNYTIQFASFIPLTDLPASEALQIAFVGIRLCGKGFVDVSGQVNRTLLQDVTELTSFNKSYYELGVTKAAAALAAPVVYVHGTGRSLGLCYVSQIRTVTPPKAVIQPVLRHCRCNS